MLRPTCHRDSLRRGDFALRLFTGPRRWPPTRPGQLENVIRIVASDNAGQEYLGYRDAISPQIRAAFSHDPPSDEFFKHCEISAVEEARGEAAGFSRNWKLV